MVRACQGFSRLDVVVLCVLVLLSTGMFLPAAQEVKEAEKRQRCMNNLKKLGLAGHNYQSAYNRLPPGWLGPLDNEKSPKYEAVQNLSVLPFLLPFVELNNVFRELQSQSPAGSLDLRAVARAWFADPELIKVASTRIEVFLCPSAPDQSKAVDGIIVGIHFANRADRDKPLVESPFHALPQKDAAFATLGRTNYFGVAGMYGRGSNTSLPGTLAGIARFEGIFTNRSQTSIDQITSADGTSHTLMFGEGTGGSHDGGAEKPDSKAPMQYAASWMGMGALPTGGGLAQHGGPSFWYQFSSAHEGVVNFCFADGAVRALRSANTSAVLYPKAAIPKEPAARDSGASPYWIVQELAGVRDAGIRPLDSVVVREKP